MEYEGNITELKNDEVFVFGSNGDGFHGAGAAGYASFNEVGNVWRKHDYANKPNGWLGKWNVKGKAFGPQKGTIGKSYAIPTVISAGQKRSLDPELIRRYIQKFYIFASQRPLLKFYVAQDAKPGLNGYSPDEMAAMYKSAPIPNNVYFKKEFNKLICKQI